MNLHSLRLAGVAGLVVLLAACGGGGDGSPSTPPADPTAAVSPEASRSSAGLVAYLLALVAAPADDKAPVSLDGFTPVTPDDTDAEPLG